MYQTEIEIATLHAAQAAALASTLNASFNEQILAEAKVHNAVMQAKQDETNRLLGEIIRLLDK